MTRLLIIALLSLSASLSAQFHLGLRAGVHSLDITPGQIVGLNTEDGQTLGISVENADYGLHAGVYAQLSLGSLFLQPEILINTQKTDYRVGDITELGIVGDIFSERYTTVDIPALLGLKAGPLRVMAGPVAHLQVGNQSSLFDIDEYAQSWEDVTFGYLAGLGLQIGRIGVDLRYEGNLTAFGDHMRFFGQRVEFDEEPSRVLASFYMQF